MEAIKIVLSAFFSLIGAADKAGRNGFGLDDIPLFINPLTQLPAAFSRAQEALDAFKGLDAAGRSELLAFIKSEFDLVDDGLEEAIEATLSVIVQAYGVYEMVKALKPSVA